MFIIKKEAGSISYTKEKFNDSSYSVCLTFKDHKMFFNWIGIRDDYLWKMIRDQGAWFEILLKPSSAIVGTKSSVSSGKSISTFCEEVYQLHFKNLELKEAKISISRPKAPWA